LENERCVCGRKVEEEEEEGRWRRKIKGEEQSSLRVFVLNQSFFSFGGSLEWAWEDGDGGSCLKRKRKKKMKMKMKKEEVEEVEVQEVGKIKKCFFFFFGWKFWVFAVSLFLVRWTCRNEVSGDE
jgi:hypothetical protein